VDEVGGPTPPASTIFLLSFKEMSIILNLSFKIKNEK